MKIYRILKMGKNYQKVKKYKQIKKKIKIQKKHNQKQIMKMKNLSS